MLSRIWIAFLVVLAAALPLGLPCAVLSPNLGLASRVDLRLQRQSVGVMCEERTRRYWGAPRLRRYGPVIEAFPVFLPVVGAEQPPWSNDVISTLALRAGDATYYPFAGLRASRQPRAMKSVAMDVIVMQSQIESYLRHAGDSPLTFSRSQTYPAGLVPFDLLATAMILVIGRYWTWPLCLAAYRKLTGAPPELFAAPFVKFFERLGQLAARLTGR